MAPGLFTGTLPLDRAVRLIISNFMWHKASLPCLHHLLLLSHLVIHPLLPVPPVLVPAGHEGKEESSFPTMGGGSVTAQIILQLGLNYATAAPFTLRQAFLSFTCLSSHPVDTVPMSHTILKQALCATNAFAGCIPLHAQADTPPTKCSMVACAHRG